MGKPRVSTAEMPVGAYVDILDMGGVSIEQQFREGADVSEGVAGRKPISTQFEAGRMEYVQAPRSAARGESDHY